MLRRFIFLIAVASFLSVSPSPTTAHAAEPWLITLEPGFAMPMGDTRGLFDPGVAGAFSVQRPAASWLLFGLRLRGVLLFDAPAPGDPNLADPGVGTVGSLLLLIRIRPLATDADPRRGTGLYVEGAFGGGITGDLWRAMIEVGVGYGFEFRRFAVGPAIRYLHVVEQGRGPLDSDAHLLLFGLEIVLGDVRKEVTAPERDNIGIDITPGDDDRDGVLDENDDCPLQLEDIDGFNDEDGCPDVDNDEDGVPDVDDQCVLEPEDIDGLGDEDGCPEDDWDGDHIPDTEDQCADLPEIVNGNDDQDGCPDEGVIAMVGDRIIIDDHLLFAEASARISPSGRRYVAALVNLAGQRRDFQSLVIEGHAAAEADQSGANRLAARRARVLARELTDAGLVLPTEVRGLGQERPRDGGHDARIEVIAVGARPAPSGLPGRPTTELPAERLPSYDPIPAPPVRRQGGDPASDVQDGAEDMVFEEEN